MQSVNRIEVPTYSAATRYEVGHVVTRNSLFYASKSNGNKNHQPPNTSYWKSFADTDFDFVDFWVPSYNSALSSEPATTKAQLNDGVVKITQDGININLLKFDITFAGVEDETARGILAFLEYKGSDAPFDFSLPPPFETSIRVVCARYSHAAEKYNINNLSINLEEIPSII